jgi:hypothetical protein
MSEPTRRRGKLAAWLISKSSKFWWSVSGIAAVALIADTLSVGVTHGRVKLALIFGAILLAGVQVAVQGVREETAKEAERSSEQVEKDTRRATNVAVSSTLGPILRLVLELLETDSESKRITLRAEIVVAVVTAAVASVGPDEGVRASFFILDVDQEGSPLRLSWSGRMAGRADEPKSVFEAGTTRGDAAIGTVVEDVPLFCRDVDAYPPPGWDEHPHNYRTFLAVPVRGAAIASGMLTVDALEPGDLELERDKHILLVLARILAVSQIGSDPDVA